MRFPHQKEMGTPDSMGSPQRCTDELPLSSKPVMRTDVFRLPSARQLQTELLD